MGLPTPIRELHFTRVLVGEGPGIRERLKMARLKDFRFDFAWPDYMVALEMDGGGFVVGGHSRGAGMRSDCEKLCTAVAMGWRVLRVVPDHVKDGRAVQWIRQTLEMANATLHLAHQAS